MVTDFLSVFQSLANSYAVSFSPLRIGEQVLVIPYFQAKFHYYPMILGY